MNTSTHKPYHQVDYLTVIARFALAASFLLLVADRFGLYGPPGDRGVSWGTFNNFLAYNAQVNSFMPKAIQPLLGITATACEFTFGVMLLLGIFTRQLALLTAGLLLLFGIAMAISFGIKSPFDYSVFSALSAALFLAAWGRYPLSLDALLKRNTYSLDVQTQAQT